MQNTYREAALIVHGSPAEIENAKACIKPLPSTVEVLVSKKERFHLIGRVGDINRLEYKLQRLACRVESTLQVQLIEEDSNDYVIPEPG